MPPESPITKLMHDVSLLQERVRKLESQERQGTDAVFDSLQVGTTNVVNPGQIAAGGSIWSATNGSSSGFFAGDIPDVQFYRSAANTWRTPNSLIVAGAITTELVGTWTPTFVGLTTAGVYTYTNQVGYYVKIGGMVFLFARISISAIGTPPAGAMTIGGIPFAAIGTHYAGFSFGLISNFNNAAGAIQLTMFTGVGLSRLDLYESFDNGGAVAVPAANFTNAACDLIFSGFYLHA